MPTMCSLTSKQLEELQVRYELNCNPSRKQVDDISTKMGLKSANVWVWFHRQRIREKSKIDSQRTRRVPTLAQVDVSRSTNATPWALAVQSSRDRCKSDRQGKLGHANDEKAANMSLPQKHCGGKSQRVTNVGIASSKCKGATLRSCLKKTSKLRSSPRLPAMKSNPKVKFALSEDSTKEQEGTRTQEKRSKDCNGNLVPRSRSVKSSDEAMSRKDIPEGGGKEPKSDTDKGRSQIQNVHSPKKRLPTETTDKHHTRSKATNLKSPGNNITSSMHTQRAAEKNLRSLTSREQTDVSETCASFKLFEAQAGGSVENSQRIVTRNVFSRVLHKPKTIEADHNCSKSSSTGKDKDTSLEALAQSSERKGSDISVGTDIPVVANQRQRNKTDISFARSVNVGNLKKIKLAMRTGKLVKTRNETQKDRACTAKTAVENVHEPAMEKMVSKATRSRTAAGEDKHTSKIGVRVADPSKDKECMKRLQADGLKTKKPMGYAISFTTKKEPKLRNNLSGRKLRQDVLVPNARTGTEVKPSHLVEESKKSHNGYSPNMEEEMVEQPRMKMGENVHTFKPVLSTERLKYCDDKFLFKKELAVNLIRVEVSALESRKVTVASKCTKEMFEETKVAAVVKSKELSAPHRSVWDSLASLPQKIRSLETSLKTDESKCPKDVNVHEVGSSLDAVKTNESSDLTEKCSSTKDSLTNNITCDSQDKGAIDDGYDCSDSESAQEIDFVVVDEVWGDFEKQLDKESDSWSTVNERDKTCVPSDLDRDDSSCNFDDRMDAKSHDVSWDTCDKKMGSDTVPSPDTTTPESLHSEDDLESASPKHDEKYLCKTPHLSEKGVRSNLTLHSISVDTERFVADSSVVGEMHVSHSSDEKSIGLVIRNNDESSDMHGPATKCNLSEELGASCESGSDDLETKGDEILVSMEDVDESTPLSTGGTEGITKYCESDILLPGEECLQPSSSIHGKELNTDTVGEVHMSPTSDEKSSGHVTGNNYESANMHGPATECNISEKLGASCESGSDDQKTRRDEIFISVEDVDESTPLSTEGTEDIECCESDILLPREECLQPSSSIDREELGTDVHESTDAVTNQRSGPMLLCTKSDEMKTNHVPPHVADSNCDFKIPSNEDTTPNEENFPTVIDIKVPQEPIPCTRSPLQECRKMAATKSDMGVSSTEHSGEHYTAEEQKEEAKQPLDEVEKKVDVSTKLSLNSYSNSVKTVLDGSDVSFCTATEASDDFDDGPPLVIDFDDTACVTEAMLSEEEDNAVHEKHIPQGLNPTESDKSEACMPSTDGGSHEENSDVMDEVRLDQIPGSSQSSVVENQDDGINVNQLIPQATASEISKDQKPCNGIHGKKLTVHDALDPGDISHVILSPMEDSAVGSSASPVVLLNSATHSDPPEVCSANHSTSVNDDCSSSVPSRKACEEDSCASTKCSLKERTCPVINAPECTSGTSSAEFNQDNAKDASQDTPQTTVSMSDSDSNQLAISPKLCHLEPRAKLKRKRCLDELVSKLAVMKKNPVDELLHEKASRYDHLPQCPVSINRKMQYASMSGDGHKRQQAPAEPPTRVPKGRLIVNKNRKRPPIPEEILCNIQAHMPAPFDKDWREVQSLVRDATCTTAKEIVAETLEEPSQITPLQASRITAHTFEEFLYGHPADGATVPPPVSQTPKDPNLSASHGSRTKQHLPPNHPSVKKRQKHKRRRASDEAGCVTAAKKSLFARGSQPSNEIHHSSRDSLNVAQPFGSPATQRNSTSFQAASPMSEGFSPAANPNTPERSVIIEPGHAPPSYQRHMAMRRASMDSPRTAVEDFQLPSIVRVYSLQDEGTQNLEDRLVKDKNTENPSLPNGGVLQEDTSSHNSTETGAMIGTLSAEVSQSHIAGRIWYPPSPGQVNPRGPEVLNHQSMPQVSMNHAPVVENGSYVQSSNQLSCIIVSPTGNAPTSMHNVPLAINSPPPTPPQQIHIPVPSHLSGIQFLPAAPCVENNNQNPRLCGRDHSGGNVTDTSSHPPVEVNKVPLLMKLLETDLLMTSRSYPQPQWRNILPTVNTSLNTDSQQVVSSADAHFQAQNCNQAGINKGTTDRSNSDSPPVCTIYPSGSGIMAPNPQLQLFHK